MNAWMASSKLSGWSETGLALGIDSPCMTSAIVQAPLCISSEHASAGACSASCYDGPKDVRVLALIVPKRKLRQVQRQVVFANVMKCSHNAALHQRPETFNIVRVHLAAHVLPAAMAARLMRNPTPIQRVIAGMLVCGDQIDALGNGLTDEAIQDGASDILNDLRRDVALPCNRADHGDLALCPGKVLPLVLVAVLVLAADKRFIHFDHARQFSKGLVLHRRSDAMAHIPGRPIIAASDLTVNLHGADALLALRHQVDHLEPGPQGVIGVLKDRPGQHRKAVAIPSAALVAFAHPMEGPRLQRINLLILAARTAHALGPTLHLKKPFTRLFRRKERHQLGQRQIRHGRHGCYLPVSRREHSTFLGGCQVQHNRLILRR